MNRALVSLPRSLPKRTVGAAAASLSRRNDNPVPRWQRAALGGLAALVALFGVQLLMPFLPAAVAEALAQNAVNVTFLGSGVLCMFSRSESVGQRNAWRWVGAALICWGLGNVYFTIVLWDADPLPVPSPADALWILFYPLLYTGLALLSKARVVRVRATLMLDGLIAALVAGSVSATIIFDVVVRSTQGAPAVVATTLAYPVGSLILLVVAVTAVAVSGWNVRSSWGWIALALSVFMVADGLYMVGTATGTWDVNSPVGVGWPLAAILLAFTASRPNPASQPDSRRGASDVLPAVVFGTVGIAMLVWDHFSPVNTVALTLSAMAMVAILGRIVVSVRQKQVREDQLREAQRLARLGNWELDIPSGRMTWSDEQYRLLDYPAEQMTPVYETFLEKVHPQDRPTLHAAFQRCVQSGGHFAADVRSVNLDGSVRWLTAQGQTVGTPDALPTCIRGTTQDITDRKVAQDALVESQEQYRLALESSRLGRFEINFASGEAAWSPEVEVILGLEPGTLPDNFADSLHLVHPDDQSRVLHTFGKASTGSRQVVEYRVVRPDGTIVWVEARGSAQVDGGSTALVGVIANITPRKVVELELEFVAKHDALTGVCNREEVQRQSLLRSAGDSPLAVLMLDLDGFKDVNDAFGHHVGDLVLIEIARRIRVSIRPDDVVGRLGGDEFVVIAAVRDARHDAEVIAGQLIEALREPIHADGVKVHVGASIGIAVSTAGTGADQLLHCADVAMYRAKRSGNTWAVYDAAIDTERIQRVALLADLRAAIHNAEIDVYFQPQADLRTGAIVGVEALARWCHPVRGFISPIDFVTLAEHTGLIAPLTDVVLSKALSQAHRWHAEGWPIPVAVNVSPLLLTRPGFAGDVAAATARAGVDASLVTLELTESGVADAGAEALRCLQELTDRGFEISIDDFGTGFSSLSYLTRLPAKELKLDRSFIARLPAAREVVVVRGVITMAKELGMTVVAEGIESPDVMALLGGLGCEIGQGYAISRPQPATAVTALLANKSPGRVMVPDVRWASTEAAQA